MIDACPKYYVTENSLIVKQENDFTPLNITFIQLKISPQKDSNDLISTPLIVNHGFFFFVKIENNWNYNSS